MGCARQLRGPADITLEELGKPGLVFQIGNDGDRIDVLTAIDGVDFEDAWNAREYHDIGGITVPVLSVPDLLRNKKASGPPKDLYDAAWIERRFGTEGRG